MDERTLTEIRTKAEEVDMQDRSYKQAFVEEREAQVAFLTALKVAVRPALSCIVSPIDKGWTTRGLFLLGEDKIKVYLLEDETFGILELGEETHKLSSPIESEDLVEVIAKSVSHRDQQLSAIRTLVGRIERALHGQLGGKKQQREDAVRRLAAKLRALTILLQD